MSDTALVGGGFHHPPHSAQHYPTAEMMDRLRPDKAGKIDLPDSESLPWFRYQTVSINDKDKSALREVRTRRWNVHDELLALKTFTRRSSGWNELKNPAGGPSEAEVVSYFESRENDQFYTHIIFPMVERMLHDKEDGVCSHHPALQDRTYAKTYVFYGSGTAKVLRFLLQLQDHIQNLDFKFICIDINDSCHVEAQAAIEHDIANGKMDHLLRLLPDSAEAQQKSNAHGRRRDELLTILLGSHTHAHAHAHAHTQKTDQHQSRQRESSEAKLRTGGRIVFVLSRLDSESWVTALFKATNEHIGHSGRVDLVFNVMMRHYLPNPCLINWLASQLLRPGAGHVIDITPHPDSGRTNPEHYMYGDRDGEVGDYAKRRVGLSYPPGVDAASERKFGEEMKDYRKKWQHERWAAQLTASRNSQRRRPFPMGEVSFIDGVHCSIFHHTRDYARAEYEYAGMFEIGNANSSWNKVDWPAGWKFPRKGNHAMLIRKPQSHGDYPRHYVRTDFFRHPLAPSDYTLPQAAARSANQFECHLLEAGATASFVRWMTGAFPHDRDDKNFGNRKEHHHEHLSRSKLVSEGDAIVFWEKADRSERQGPKGENKWKSGKDVLGDFNLLRVYLAGEMHKHPEELCKKDDTLDPTHPPSHMFSHLSKAPN